MPARSQSPDTFEVVLTRLRESHDVSVYEAIERLVQAGEATGFGTDALLRMLDHGMTFAGLLELIESKVESLRKAA